MKLPDRTYNEKWKSQHGRCFYCGVDLKSIANIEIDHIIPFSISKDGSKSNLCLCCKHCNRLKSNLLPEKFKEVVVESYPSKLIRGLFYYEFLDI